jgi:addiction module HigA family antidote
MQTAEEKGLLQAYPGYILRTEFLEPMGLNQADLVRRTGIPTSRWTEIIRGRRRVSGETAFALGLVFNMDPQFWLNLQSGYDLPRARIERGAELRKRVEPINS